MISLPNGCDSLVFLDLIVLPEITSFIDINLCEGETFSIGNAVFSTTGIFAETIPNAIGCDSTVTLVLTMIDCELVGTINATTPVCNGDENGTLLFSLQNGIPPFTYNWENINNTAIGGSGSLNSWTDVLLENIPAGVYEIYISDSVGDDIVFIQEVLNPPVLTANINAVDYNGYNLTCFNANDGMATAIGNGGVPPYSFLWNNTEIQPIISNVSAGLYEVELTDANGCTVLANVNLTEPVLLEFVANYIDPNCDGAETGIIQLEAISGGTQPYSFALDESPYNSSESYQNLGAGNYDFSVLDANRCFADTSSSLIAPDIPILFMDESQAIDLGCEVMIGAQTNNTSLIDINWTNVDNSLDCADCLETNAAPVNDTEYILTVTSIDNCSTSDSIFVKVNKIRDVYSPNVFSPNNDGINDLFFLYANKSVSHFRTFKIFNRWGALMYETTDLIPNEASSGWDGSFKGEPMNAGVYVWMAEAEYLDGVVSIFSGDIAILK